MDLFCRIRRRCGQGCSSGATGSQDDGGFGNDGVYAMTTYNVHSGIFLKRLFNGFFMIFNEETA